VAGGVGVTVGNPDHPVTKMMDTEWHKVAAMLMLHHGLDAFEITPALIQTFERAMAGHVVVADCRAGKFVIRIMLERDALAFAVEEPS
jgi:hypothetical protein